MSTVLDRPFSEQFREPDTPYLSPARVGELFGFQVQERMRSTNPMLVSEWLH